ncbi:MAG: hypothetical protein JSV68_03430, partial [Anaerolineaceae bacterium]
GSLALVHDAYLDARQYLQQSVAIDRERGDRGELSYALAFLGYAERGLGNLDLAQEYVNESLQTAVETRYEYSVLTALNGAALILADRDEKGRALEIYGLTSRYPVTGESPVTRQVIGRHIVAVAETLPPDIAKAAMARGRELDLWETATAISARLGIDSPNRHDSETPSSLPLL